MTDTHDVVGIITNFMDGARAAMAVTRRTDSNIDDARVMLDDLASGLPLAEQERYWRAIFGRASARMQHAAVLQRKPLAWGGRGCERDIEERRIEEADEAEAGFDAEHLDRQPQDSEVSRGD